MSSKHPKKRASTCSGGGGVLEKIHQLKDFCGTGWTDGEYTDCLRRYAYSVERAAEALMTGLYKPSSSSSVGRHNKQSATVNLLTPPRASKSQATSKSATKQSYAKVVRKPPPSANAISTARSANAVRNTPCNLHSNDAEKTNWMIVCERWISNAINTTKYGRTEYQERVRISASPNVRFQGSLAAGKLPEDLNAFLLPLLQADLIQLHGHFLMADAPLAIGAHVPLSLRVDVAVDEFFAVFHNPESSSTNTLSHNNSSTTKGKRTLSLETAAFRLLQWAELGNIPEFTPQPLEEPVSGTELDEWKEEDENAEEEETSTIEITTESHQLPLAEAPKGFNDVSLRPYQQQALHWMWQRETAGESQQQQHERLHLLKELSGMTTTSTSGASAQPPPSKGIVCDCGPVRVADDQKPPTPHHPLWSCRYLASSDLTTVKPFYVHDLLNTVTTDAPAPPQPCSGGILADSMGLGKTVMLLALILRGKEHEEPTNAGTTLVVAKLSLLPQWEEEIRSKTSLTHKMHYGSASRLTGKDMAGVDVVVTTYGTLQAEMSQDRSPILSFGWHRIILDEAHCIRNPRTMASKACCQLQATHRWCVTGTIIQNSLEDIYGMMKFLKHEPWCMATFWKAAITNVKADDPEQGAGLALDRIRRLLEPIYLRRTKDSVTLDGKPILTLPPKECKIVHLDLTESEREFYNVVLARSQDIFQGFVDSGKANNSYMQIFGMLQRLRQVCDHIALTVHSRFRGRKEAKSKRACVDTVTLEATGTVPPQQDALGKAFLEGLLSKFCEKQNSPRKPKSSRRGSPHDDNETTPPKKLKLDPDFLSSVIQGLSQAVVERKSTHLSEECSVCLDAPKIEDVVLTPCAHIFCRQCLVDCLKCGNSQKSTALNGLTLPLEGNCPICQESFATKKIVKLARSDAGTVSSHFLMENSPVPNKVTPPMDLKKISQEQQQETQEAARQILSDAIEGTESSKITAILEELRNIWQLDPGSKVLLFSHYLGFLDLLEIQFRSADIPFFRLDGSLSLKERMTVLESFRVSKNEDDSRQGTVLLMSMMAGAEGLNLVSASSCFICDPWWNHAKEDQCINRIHRIGQMASVVRVRRFIVRDSVEERIAELQTRKKYVADEIYSKGGGAIDPTVSGRLALDDFKLIFRR